MASQFAHCHVHTEYSMLDGASRLEPLIRTAAEDGQPALAITDHGVLYGLVDFWDVCNRYGVKPILGMEGYYVPYSRFDRPPRATEQAHRNHITLLAVSDEGYRNLVQISSKAFLDGYFEKPRIDDDLLSSYRAGLIATTGCLGGRVPQLLLGDQVDRAEAELAKFRDIFGAENFFVEVMQHDFAEEQAVTPLLIELADRVSVPLLLTNDSHYTYQDDAEAHDVLLCVQTNSRKDDLNRLKFSGSGYWLKSTTEMRDLALGRERPDAADNTLAIAERANVHLEFGRSILPAFALPAGETDESYLRKLVDDGAAVRWGHPLDAGYRERLDYELSVICDMGFATYFLVVADLIGWARARGIRVGPGRGSAAGSAVSYSLRITDIDPLKYGLIFERFLNPGRRQMPDIDMDFDERRRGEVIAYAANKYGHDRVAQIVTFSRIKARAAVRDAARTLGYPASLGDRIAKMMPPLVMGRDTPLGACFERTPGHEDGYAAAGELRCAASAEPDVQKVVDVARGLEGLRRQDSIHAAAVVITRDPLTDHVPVQRKGEGAEVVTQYEMNAVERLGLLKMDFLGLRNLSVIEVCLDLIRANRGEDLDIDHIPLDDEPTFELLRRGQALGTFQFEGAPMRGWLRQLQPTTFDDIAAIIALYRPGPMDSIPVYISRKHGKEPVTYLHPDLEPILARTYGVLVFQEAVIDIAHRIAGFDLPKADAFRKAVGKKIREVVREQRDGFLSGCLERGYDRSFAENLFSLIEPFADYGFNASHAYAYALVAYQTAFLKANYPVEYMAALLSSAKDDKDRKPRYLAEARAMGISVTTPCVNRSGPDFASRDGTIPFGLSAVRNVGEAVAHAIIDERDSFGEFSDFVDFCGRAPTTALNKRVMESLIKGGAFDSFGYSRRALIDVSESVVERVVARRRAEAGGQFSLFDGGAEPAARVDALDVRIGNEEWDPAQQLAFEKEMLGLYVSNHPIFGFETALREKVEVQIADIEQVADGEIKTLGGVIANLRSRVSKNGGVVVTFDLEDLEATVEVVCFAKTAEKFATEILADTIVLVRGKVDVRDDAPVVTALEIKRLELKRATVGTVTLALDSRAVTPFTIDKLKVVLSSHPGPTPVHLRVSEGGTTTLLKLGREFNVEPRSGLYAELSATFGPKVIA